MTNTWEQKKKYIKTIDEWNEIFFDRNSIDSVENLLPKEVIKELIFS
jgi:hypothetical protein